MNKQAAYIAALELAIQALASAFVRANAAELVRTAHPLSELWQMNESDREAAERADVAAYDVSPDHWGSRLALMSAFEALHGALRLMASNSAQENPQASAWRDAAVHAREAARLAREAADVFEQISRSAQAPDQGVAGYRAALMRSTSDVEQEDLPRASNSSQFMGLG